MTLQELLTMKVSGPVVNDQAMEMSPEFRVAVQSQTDEGVHIIVHALGHDSETLDFVVAGNELKPLDSLRGDGRADPTGKVQPRYQRAGRRLPRWLNAGALLKRGDRQ